MSGVVDAIRNLGLTRPRWHNARSGFATGPFMVEAGRFAGWQIDAFARPDPEGGWAAGCCFTRPGGVRANVSFIYDGPAVERRFHTSDAAKQALWIALTGDDRAMPLIRFWSDHNGAVTDAAGLPGVLPGRCPHP